MKKTPDGMCYQEGLAMIFLVGIALGMLIGAVATFIGIWRAEYGN